MSTEFRDVDRHRFESLQEELNRVRAERDAMWHAIEELAPLTPPLSAVSLSTQDLLAKAWIEAVARVQDK